MGIFAPSRRVVKARAKVSSAASAAGRPSSNSIQIAATTSSFFSRHASGSRAMCSAEKARAPRELTVSFVSASNVSAERMSSLGKTTATFFGARARTPNAAPVASPDVVWPHDSTSGNAGSRAEESPSIFVSVFVARSPRFIPILSKPKSAEDGADVFFFFFFDFFPNMKSPSPPSLESSSATTSMDGIKIGLTLTAPPPPRAPSVAAAFAHASTCARTNAKYSAETCSP